MSSKGIGAPLAEKMLLLCVLLSIAGLFGVYTVLNSFAKTQAEASSKSLTEADASQREIDHITSSYRWMLNNTDIVTKTNKVVAEASEYKYQNQIINDLESYANRSGVYIQGYAFSDTAASATGGATGSTGTAPSSTAAAPPPSTGSGTQSGAPTQTGTTSTTPVGLTPASVELSLGGKTSYTSFLKFLKLIEQNVTRMQVTSLSLASSEDSKGYVNPGLTVSVFINKEGQGQ